MKTDLYHATHSNGFLADLAYKTWHHIYDAKETLRPLSRNQSPMANGFYPVQGLNVSTTAICNSKCIFCVHRLLQEPTDIMPNDLFTDIMREWRKFCDLKVYGADNNPFINLTPGTPPGEATCDASFPQKLEIAAQHGFRVFFVTNGIRLGVFQDIICKGGTVGAISISIPSLDPVMYKEIFGVDRGEQVKRNLFNFLTLNESLGWPVDTTICFRNAEAPSEIIAHPDYKRLRSFFGKRCRAMFTTWWDDWNGAVPKDTMERGWIKVRKPLNLNRVCQGAQSFSMRPTDRLIRLCGCRYVNGQDDLIVGSIDKGFEDAARNAFTIQDGFKRGERPKTCQSCGAYKQA
jgi:hypothetical protein